MSSALRFTLSLVLCNLMLCKADYLLVLQYAIAMCNQNLCVSRGNNPVSERFTIHGLWTIDPNGNVITAYKYPNCNRLPLVEGDLVTIRSDLDRDWPSYRGLDNFGFWLHEWVKHGRCSQLPPLQYFSLALELFDRLDVMLVLHNANIVPNDFVMYEQDKIEQAFDKSIQIQGSVRLQCAYDLHFTQQLFELRFCHSSQFVSNRCPPYKLKGNCTLLAPGDTYPKFQLKTLASIPP